MANICDQKQICDEPQLIKLWSHEDERGALGVIEAIPTAGFVFKRLYYLYNIRGGAVRGEHAHKDLHQLMVALNGSLTVTLKGRGKVFTFTLNDPKVGLLVKPGYWRSLDEFSDDAVCLVAASDEYDEQDYIRNYDEFLEWERENGRADAVK
jgi:dTDP-4-dehydrorhamnose 3,5-epimerase-like enzyme